MSILIFIILLLIVGLIPSLAMAAGAKPLAEEIRGRLEAYRQSKPWRQPQGSQDQPQP